MRKAGLVIEHTHPFGAAHVPHRMVATSSLCSIIGGESFCSASDRTVRWVVRWFSTASLNNTITISAVFTRQRG